MKTVQKIDYFYYVIIILIWIQYEEKEKKRETFLGWNHIVRRVWMYNFWTKFHSVCVFVLNLKFCSRFKYKVANNKVPLYGLSCQKRPDECTNDSWLPA